MMKLKQPFYQLLLVAIIITPLAIHGQAFNEPESVVYDATNDRYLVSNKGSGDIIIVPRTDPTNLEYFYKNDNCVSLRGMTIVDGILWAAGTNHQTTQNQYLYSFDLNPDNYLKQINISTAVFINDVTTDADGMLYVSDGDNNKIYKVNTTTGGYSDLNFSGANGLLFDEANNRLLYTDDTDVNTSRISSIDLATNTTSVLITNSTFQTLDGLTVDHLGNYYVSAWSTNTIYRYDPSFTSSVVASSEHPNIIGTPHSGPADIFFDQVNNVLAVPNFNLNTVDFIPFVRLSTENNKISIPTDFSLYQNYPNPFNPTTSIDYEVAEESLVNITIYDLLGTEVVQLVTQIEQAGLKSVLWNGKNTNGADVNAGVYLYKLNSGNITKTMKMVLIK